MPAHDPAELLAAYDTRVRAHVPASLRPGVVAERDGPLVRFTGFGSGGFVVCRDLAGLDGADLDELIARQVRIFRDRRADRVRGARSTGFAGRGGPSA